MWKWKWYAILLLWLSLILVFSPAACSQLSTTEKSPQEGQPASQKPAKFEVGSITFEPSTVMVNDSVTVTATAKNIGDVNGTYTAIFTIDGQEIDKKDVTIEPGDNKEVSFQLSKTAPGTYNLAIGNSSAILTVYEWKPYKIQYDETPGTEGGIYVSGEIGHIIHFTPPAKPFRVQKIIVFGTVHIVTTSDFDEKHITARIWNKEGTNQLWSQDFSWRLFMGSAQWREIEVPDVRVDDDFYVEIVTRGNPMSLRAGGTLVPLDASIDFSPMGSSIVLGVSTLCGPLSVVVIGFDYPQSYTESPLNRTETRSGYSLMGKLIDPGRDGLKAIRWLIRVEGEGPTSN
ncbi:MAG: hypothetical protein H8E40_02770 [Chloroflexi bacterium]|nr:hypothetical protein [Chloroflexota bacterium]